VSIIELFVLVGNACYPRRNYGNLFLHPSVAFQKSMPIGLAFGLVVVIEI